jgi:general secretion pathway protein G
MTNNDTKICPYCAETIKKDAKICRFCQFDLATGKPIGSGKPIGAGDSSISKKPKVKAQSSVTDGVKLGCGMFIVLPILIILGFIIFMFFMGKLPDMTMTKNTAGSEKIIKAKMDIASLETALKMYKLDNGVYPSTEQGLLALVEKPETGMIPKKWREGGYLETRKVPKDPWGNEFVYISPGVHGDFDLISYGRDGVPGGDDKAGLDINNWEIE